MSAPLILTTFIISIITKVQFGAAKPDGFCYIICASKKVNIYYIHILQLKTVYRHRQWYDFWPNGMTYFGSNGIDRLFFKI